jgi:rare lipoprotein A
MSVQSVQGAGTTPRTRDTTGGRRRWSRRVLGALAGAALVAGGFHEAQAASARGTTESCQASFYTGTVTASGERFDPNALTAAHKAPVPFGTRLRVSGNGHSVVVRVNDRGPFVPGRCIDLTPAAFKRLAPLSTGVLHVRVTPA